MTNILLYRSNKGELSGFQVSGHTGFAKAGEDIVCSAISFMSITCTNALESVAGIKPELIQKDALLDIRVAELNEKAITIFKVFEQGMKDLESSYPTHIKLSTTKLPK